MKQINKLIEEQNNWLRKLGLQVFNDMMSNPEIHGDKKMKHIKIPDHLYDTFIGFLDVSQAQHNIDDNDLTEDEKAVLKLVRDLIGNPAQPAKRRLKCSKPY